MFDPSKIPGMIEPVEQQMLTWLGGDPFVAEQGAIVEFGTFFGRSTACLISGALRWWSPGRAPAVFAFDSFSCAVGRGFAREVLYTATKAGVTDLVRTEGDHLNFRPVYDHFVGSAETLGILKTTASELRDSQRPCDRIALMHLDSPKFYQELKYVLVRFFPALVPGARVVFQDYFYQWSASVIAAVQLMIEKGLLAPKQSAASALLTQVIRVPSLEDVQDLDEAMSGTPITELIDRAIVAMKSIKIDRPEQFLARLYLAKLQYLWEQGKFAEAEKTLMQLLDNFGNTMSSAVFSPFRELMRHGFSMRSAYELDHSERTE